jgi:hypothetical protein
MSCKNVEKGCVAGEIEKAGILWITPMPSRTYEAGIEGTGEGYIDRSLNEGAAIGEESDGVGWALKAEQEVVEADDSVGGETVAHGGEVHGTMVFVDLDGVAAAEGDVGAAFSGEMGEDALAADGAGRVRGGSIYFAAGAGPEIEGQEGSAYQVGLASEEFEGFGDLDGGGEIDGSIKDAGGVAGFHGTGWGFGEDAGKTGSREQGVGSRRLRGRLRFGEDGHGGGVGAYGCGVDPGFGLLDGVVVDEVTGLEVVGGVEDEVGGGEQFVDVGGHKVGDVGVDGDGGVEESDLAVGGLGLGERLEGVGLVE